MLPAVPEVVLITHPIPGPLKNVMKSCLPLADPPYAKLRIGLPVGNLPSLKLMKVSVSPTHDRLEDPMKLAQGDVPGHLEAPPNRRPGPAECDLETENLLFLGQRFLSSVFPFSPFLRRANAPLAME